MLELKGKYGDAKVFTDNIDQETISQVIGLLNQPYAAESKIRIMPDCHAGSGCVIGTTMTLTDKVVPNLVGVDIGCGMYALQLEETDIDLSLLDAAINQYVPAGFNSMNTRSQPQT
jgi:RNA-splicing ligase RtcB